MNCLGIDLGTTNTVAAYINAANVPELLPDARFNETFLTPSVFHISGNTCVVGESLERIQAANRQLNVVRNSKLSMGSDKPLLVDPENRSWTAESIAATLLRKVKKDAEVKLGYSIDEALIAVPANFDSSQRLATQFAANLAGFKQVDLVEEPVAAAASYSFGAEKSEQTIFVYDLGGGTFDATVIHSSGDGLYTLSTLGSKEIGGKFLDELIVDELKALFKSRYGKEAISKGALDNFRRFAEQAKCELHPEKNYSINKSVVAEGKVMDVSFSYHHLSKLIYPLLDQTMSLSAQCLSDAGLTWAQVDKVLLVGGSSQLPAVKDKICRLTNKRDEEILLYQPHESIAYGAAILANKLFAESGAHIQLKQQIASNYLGLRTYNPSTQESSVDYLVDRNTPLPQSVHKVFYTSRKNQEKMDIELVQAKQETDAGESLGVFSFGPFENENPNIPVDIQITYGRDGVVTVEAEQQETGVKVSGIATENLRRDVGEYGFLENTKII